MDEPMSIQRLDTLVSLNECARQLGLNPMSLWRWIKALNIPHTRISNVMALEPAKVKAILVANGKIWKEENRPKSTDTLAS